MQSLLNSFRFAFGGLRYALATQRNLRIHLTAAALALWMGRRQDAASSEPLMLCSSAPLAAPIAQSRLFTMKTK